MLGTESIKKKRQETYIGSALSVGSKESETVRIPNVSSAGLGVCVRPWDMRESLQRARAAWKLSLEKVRRCSSHRQGRGEEHLQKGLEVQSSDTGTAGCAGEGSVSSNAKGGTVTTPEGPGASPQMAQGGVSTICKEQATVEGLPARFYVILIDDFNVHVKWPGGAKPAG